MLMRLPAIQSKIRRVKMMIKRRRSVNSWKSTLTSMVCQSNYSPNTCLISFLCVMMKANSSTWFFWWTLCLSKVSNMSRTLTTWAKATKTWKIQKISRQNKADDTSSLSNDLHILNQSIQSPVDSLDHITQNPGRHCLKTNSSFACLELTVTTKIKAK